MNLFNSTSDRESHDDFWEMLDVSLTDAREQQPVRALSCKLNNTLNDLGKLNYELTNSLDGLRCDLTSETHDHLHGQISAIVGPEIKSAMAALAEALVKARTLTDELISDSSQRTTRKS